MILNGVIAQPLRNFTEFGCFRDGLRRPKSGWIHLQPGIFLVTLDDLATASGN